MSKKERIVAAIENGTVIDHIPAEKTYEVANLLKISEIDTPVTIGSNYISKKLGKKGIIKVEDKYFSDAEISQLSVVAHRVVLNIIHDYEVVEKKTVTLPDRLLGIVKCNNPKCITNNEPMSTYFTVVDKLSPHPELRCRYCDKVQDIDKVELCK
ncbi:aspartate carbamoyltransferase regulatory subunit [Palleniella muris]|uniref:Aspartate carbamoyltransferase regulatory subunit n=1 Tax=Palleniella muris TaxID=3038145 RepID=A0AC61QSR0_9BACT|nr:MULTISPECIES: aspartate carbamoyltransferase regulatory subunit [Palleniella]NPD80561.1 aspartate carbamoyltransferase regulatory subunit [Palleniella intestinalis]TGX83500.1 aspartate carbamoyltransferase regulatory subunit [Palleniella muris]